MKKISISILILVVVGLGILAGRFYYQNLRGIGPAILPPAGNIAEQIESSTTPATTTSSTETKPTPAPSSNDTGMPLTLPPGFSISVFAKNLGDPRVIVEEPDGLLYVSIPSLGKVIAMENKDGVLGQSFTVAEGLNHPHGIAFRCLGETCKIYIAETDKLKVYDFDKTNHSASNGKKIADLPSGGNHITRSLLFLPPPNDDKLLISIGSSCNVCHESDPKRATIYVINADGTGFKEYVRGLRNSVFMTVKPDTNQVWATEMGRDLLGDDIPPDEINIIEEGKNYGWPICYGQNVHDTEFDKNTYIRNPCMEPFETPSRIDIPAHSAPLGLSFFPKEGWPAEFQNDILVAFHGSWNRSVPTGYKLVRLHVDDQGQLLQSEDFITGWLKDGQALGRPVGILIRPDLTIFVTDDKAGVVYRVVYNK